MLDVIGVGRTARTSPLLQIFRSLPLRLLKEDNIYVRKI
jgi:hypothetical protein